MLFGFGHCEEPFRSNVVDILEANGLSVQSKKSVNPVFWDGTFAWNMGYRLDEFKRERNILAMENTVLGDSKNYYYLDIDGYGYTGSIRKYRCDELATVKGTYAEDGPILICLQGPTYQTTRGMYHDTSNYTNHFLEQCYKYLPEWKYEVRMHPSHRNYPIRNMRSDWTIDPWDMKLHDKLPHCRGIVTINSNCAIQAMYAGVPVATLGRGPWSEANAAFDCYVASNLRMFLHYKVNTLSVRSFLAKFRRFCLCADSTKEDILHCPPFKKFIDRLLFKEIKTANAMNDYKKVKAKILVSEDSLLQAFLEEHELLVENSDTMSACQKNARRNHFVGKYNANYRHVHI